MKVLKKSHNHEALPSQCTTRGRDEEQKKDKTKRHIWNYRRTNKEELQRTDRFGKASREAI